MESAHHPRRSLPHLGAAEGGVIPGITLPSCGLLGCCGGAESKVIPEITLRPSGAVGLPGWDGGCPEPSGPPQWPNGL